MSADTLHNLEAALQAHIADESGETILVSGWVMYLTGEYLDDSSRTFYRSMTNGRQPWHSSKGLVSMLADEYESPDFDD